jgi:hypothetical protein
LFKEVIDTQAAIEQWCAPAFAELMSTAVLCFAFTAKEADQEAIWIV